MKKIILMMAFDILLLILFKIPDVIASDSISKIFIDIERGALIGVLSYLISTWLLER